MTERLRLSYAVVAVLFPLGACLTEDKGDPSAKDMAAVSVASVSFQDGVAPSASYAGTRDTYLSENAPAAKAGVETTVRADGDEPAGTGKDLAALLRWDISSIPAGAVITGVSVTLDITNPSPNPYQVYEIKRDWSEPDATWSSSSAGTAWELAGAKGASDRGTTVLGSVAGSASGAYTLALNAAGIAVVQGWAGDPSSNRGLLVVGTGTDGLAWSSREAAAAQRPRISITYESGACVATSCAAQGKNCGTIADGCGATLACGACTLPATCGGGGTANVCGTAPATPSVVTLSPEADTYVRSGSYAGTSFGGATELRVDLDDGATVEQSFVRFNVGAVGSITRARLRMYVNNGSTNSTNIFKISSLAWSESATTWNNKPAVDGAQIGTVAATSAAQWVEVDITPAVAPGAVLSLALTGRSSDAFTFSSREASQNRPQLVLDVAGSGGGCIPTTCAAQSNNCGSIPDGCGQTLQCGSCTLPATCGGGGVANVCGESTSSGDIVLAAVGDMNPSGNTSTSSASGLNAASIRNANVDMFLALGDFQYTTGTCSTLVSSWDVLWGGLMPKLFHIAGPTHDMASLTDELGYRDHLNGACPGQTSGKSAAVQLLGRSIGPLENYSFDRGNWHFTMMAATLWRYDTAAAQAATAWLDQDLTAAKAAGKHLLVTWHDPYWTSQTSSHTRELEVRPWVDILDKHDARIVLSGSQHNVEIFHPQNANDVRNDATGTQQFQVSTGGIGLRSFIDTPPNLIARDSATWGWMKLTLRASGAYSWQFVPVMGAFTHTGSRPAP